MFKVASFNTNSIRARLGLVLEWLAAEKPDVLCLQETKVEDRNFPLREFRDAGYDAVFTGRKSYNGVAIVSLHPIENVRTGIGDWAEPGEARLIEATIRGVPLVNTYVPQGRDPKSEMFAYKLKWIRAMRDYFGRRFSPGRPLLWAGDFNTAPEPIDVYDPKKLYGHIGYHPEEHKALQYVKEWGFVDVFRLHVQEGGHYTFWDYRVPNGLQRNMGWRVDHIWATQPLAERSRRAWIDVEPRRREKPSDHTFIVAEFDL
ncbi:MAG: exodeoxyribonuclease III [Peptococcaceae bacterium]|nr:exodeoxyribonuclease III [Peptococcaceae bacterium]